jgi:hypothetical protein
MKIDGLSMKYFFFTQNRFHMSATELNMKQFSDKLSLFSLLQKTLFLLEYDDV